MILFRCDSSFEMGSGHVIRCLRLAQVLRQSIPSEPVEFVCQDLKGHVSSRITDAGFPLHWVQDQGEKLISEMKPRWVVVDHYGLGEAWEKSLPVGIKIFVIDDVFRKHQADVLLDANYHSDSSGYLNQVPRSCRLLLGPAHSLLSSDLIQTRKPVFNEIKNVLCFFGGTDTSGELLKLAKSLASQPADFNFQLVALSSHKHLQALQALPLPAHISLLVSPPNWPELLALNDFYIGSGGTVTWERFFVGLPGAVIAVAENQESVSQDLAHDGFQFYWGKASAFKYTETLKKLDQALTDISQVRKMKQRGQDLVQRIDPELIKEIFSR